MFVIMSGVTALVTLSAFSELCHSLAVYKYATKRVTSDLMNIFQKFKIDMKSNIFSHAWVKFEIHRTSTFCII